MTTERAEQNITANLLETIKDWRNEMKIIRMHKEWGWEMWGLLGKNGLWFLGFSRAVSYVETHK